MEGKRSLNLKMIVVVIIGVLLLGITIITIILLNQDDGIKKTRTAISGLPEDLPSNIKALVEAGLYDAIELNLPEGETPPKTGATIRQGTLEINYDKDIDIHSGSFITDIDSVEQSFSINYEWSKNDENPYLSGYPVEIFCVEKNDRIYNKNLLCSDAFHQSNSIIDTFAEKYLPYVATTSNGIDYNIIKDYPDRNPVITVLSYTCEGSKNAEEVKKAAETWLRERDPTIDLGAIAYKNYCDSMMNTFPPVFKTN